MFKKSCFIFTLMVATNVSAAELVIDKPISAMALNGVAYSNNTVNLEPGKHQLVARYSYQLAEKGNKKKRIQSEVKVFEIDVSNQTTINLFAPKYARYAQASHAFNNDKIEWKLEDQNGEPVDYTVNFIPGRPGMLPYGDIERVVEDYNSKNDIIVDQVLGIITSTSTMVGEVETSDTEMLSDLDAAQKHYLLLNEQNRKAFKKWLIDIE
ncbi:DUF2057 family protein [Vibrio ulleungensis]|uniref:DUF2057 family protein n=1 Tax=Vibrio ulleungensis TaxID=2807619 RepID=A0ABS2HK22_9VIBR|nr:DUF2057 family protein [Vibrio ulleungensis]MBM7036181.1 DUF2057 family protein [Vibrio ulleungensis]